MYANIIIDITHEKLDKIFQYSIPSELEGMLKVGNEVIVPFGAGNKEKSGYVVGFAKDCDYDPAKIKCILRISRMGMQIESNLVALAARMKEYYGGTMIQALKTVLPIKQKEREKVARTVKLLLTEEEGKEKLSYFLSKNQKARARLLAALLDDHEVEYELLIKKLNIARTTISALEEQGIVTVESERVYRNPVKADVNHIWGREPITYTAEQSAAIEAFSKGRIQQIRKPYLLHGITGSGKTEVYMEMIASVIAEGKQAILLIPEIALTYQTVMRFYRRFGERVSIMNSRLSNGERYDQMMRAKRGEIDVMIGPRTALFTPFQELGLIVIDEEHEMTYKSEQIPRFHAREVAIWRGEIEGCEVVLGSATPSVDSYYQVEKGTFQLLELRNRSQSQELATVYTIDMREELKNGNRSILSDKLKACMAERFEKGQQMMLFLNRRGYAGFIACRACGYVVKCPHCDVSLSYHRNGKLVCHYCGYEIPHVEKCPTCGSSYIGGFRAGTQQIEEIVKREFPMAKVLRMDMDTTRQKDGHEKILSAFAAEEADVLIGTQMIVKGHDFPNVTLVGVLAADLSLYADDYRCGERTFQLLTQAAGRAGRGTALGEVTIQTYSPEHYSIVTAANQDYHAFYKEEMSYRSLMGYPPAEALMAVLMSSEDESQLERGAKYLKEFAGKVMKENGMIIGPASPHVGKVKDVYRRIIYMKSESEQVLIEVKNCLEQYIEMNQGFQKIRIQFDMNPMKAF